jgi:hypothetical protein
MAAPFAAVTTAVKVTEPPYVDGVALEETVVVVALAASVNAVVATAPLV